VVDDFENDENVRNPKMVDLGFNLLREAVIGALGEDFCFLMVGNIFHSRCVLSRFIAEKDEAGNPLYRSKVYQAILSVGKPDERPLWPESWSLDRLYDKRRIMGRTVDHQLRKEPGTVSELDADSPCFQQDRADRGKASVFDGVRETLFSQRPFGSGSAHGATGFPAYSHFSR